MVRLAYLQPNWDGEGGVPPSREIIEAAGRLAVKLALSPSEPPVGALNVGATADGRVMFSLFGLGGRQADVYVENASGLFSFVAGNEPNVQEGSLPFAAFFKLTEWLVGRKGLIESFE